LSLLNSNGEKLGENSPKVRIIAISIQIDAGFRGKTTQPQKTPNQPNHNNSNPAQLPLFRVKPAKCTEQFLSTLLLEQFSELQKWSRRVAQAAASLPSLPSG
jgi:hypothetical protein